MEDAAIDWWRSIETPALALSVLLNFVLGFVCRHLFGACRSDTTSLLEYTKSQVEQREQLTEKVLSVVSGNTEAMNAVRGSVVDETGKVVAGLDRCSRSIERVEAEVRSLVTK